MNAEHAHPNFESDNCPRCGTSQRRMGQMPAPDTCALCGHHESSHCNGPNDDECAECDCSWYRR